MEVPEEEPPDTVVGSSSGSEGVGGCECGRGCGCG